MNQRGSPTGMSMMSADLDWRNAHRIRLHHFANNDSTSPTSFIAPDLSLPPTSQRPNTVPGAESQRVMSSTQDRTEMKIETVSRELVSRFYYDMALAGDPIQCLEEDGTCDALRYVAPTPRGFYLQGDAETVGTRSSGLHRNARKGSTSTSSSSTSMGTDGGESPARCRMRDWR